MNDTTKEKEPQAEICIYCSEEWPFRLPVSPDGEKVCYPCRLNLLYREFKKAGWPDTSLYILPESTDAPSFKIPNLDKEQV